MTMLFAPAELNPYDWWLVVSERHWNERADALEAYGYPRRIDQFLDVLNYDPELALSPYYWYTRKRIIETSTNPVVIAAYNRYREAIKRIDTAEFMKGEAPGL